MDGYLGIDVSKDRLDVLLKRDAQHETQHVTNTPTGFAKLHGWVKWRAEPSVVHVCLEATGPYSEAIAEFLYAHGYRVSVVNPARIKGLCGESITTQQDRPSGCRPHCRILPYPAASSLDSALSRDPPVAGPGTTPGRLDHHAPASEQPAQEWWSDRPDSAPSPRPTDAA